MVYISFDLSQLKAEFAVFSPRVAEKGNSNVLAIFSSTVKTQIEEKCARTLELPLLVRRLVYSFCYVSTGG